jgi:phospholipid/cholesterol/gamma-HCH transport system substrate-binding protein
MEIRARYIQMGAFTLAVIAGAFAFVYWLNNVGGLGQRAVYRIRFENSVSGLLAGSAVLFNGIRVGEVTGLRLDPDNPRHVQATIAIERSAPVRADTTVGIDFQGLTGSPVIALTGGTSQSPLPAGKGEAPLLAADPAAGQSLSQEARAVLRRFDGLLAENAEPLHAMIGNLGKFSEALARNSDRLDGIVAGLERMTGGAAAKTRLATYDLTAPATYPPIEKVPEAQLVIPDPTALSVLDSEKILTRSSAGVSSSLADAQWSDTVPKLLQMKLMQAFENAAALGAVSRPLEGVTGDYQLLLDIRRFQITVAAEPSADVELTAKVLDGKGRIIDTRTFRAAVPATALTPPEAAAALDQAFATVATELVVWTSRTVAESSRPPPTSAVPKATTRSKDKRG